MERGWTFLGASIRGSHTVLHAELLLYSFVLVTNIYSGIQARGASVVLPRLVQSPYPRLGSI